jgi:glycosyltransferase involved in cell wall biosynthesis
VRVLVLTNMYPRPDRPTFGIFVKEQIEDLESLGCTIDLRVIRGDASKLNYARAVAALRRIVRDGGYDVVHAHYGLTGAVAVTQRRCPVVVTFHGSDCNGEVPWQTAISWGVSRTSHPIFVSPLLADGLGLPHAPVIPAAVDVERFAPMPRAEARARLGLSESGTFVLLPGSRSELRKRADLFDEALDHARAQRPGIEGLSMENLSRDDVALTMNAVDAVLMTSNYEGSPVAIKEALACCTPVVSVPVADVPDLIAGLPGCGVAPRHGSELAERLLEALAIGGADELRERVLPFSRTPMAAAVKRVYEAAVGHRG